MEQHLFVAVAATHYHKLRAFTYISAIHSGGHRSQSPTGSDQGVGRCLLEPPQERASVSCLFQLPEAPTCLGS